MLGKVLVGVIVLWVGLLCYLIYGVENPKKCSQEPCYAPLLRSNDHAEVTLYVVSADRSVVSPVWKHSNYSITESVNVSISVKFPSNATLSQRSVAGQLEFCVKRQHRFCFTKLLELVISRKSDPHDSNEYYLLQNKSLPDSDLVSGTRIMWKHAVEPLVLRVFNFHGSGLKSPWIDGANILLPTHELKGQRRTLFYEPWIIADDTAASYQDYRWLVSRPEPVTATLRLQIVPTPSWRMMLTKILLDILRQGASLFTANEMTHIRHMFSAKFIYRYILGQAITLLHVYLSYLAFYYDLKHYRDPAMSRKRFAGVSASSVLFEVVKSSILFLYLQNAGSSWFVLLPFGKEIFYGSWKYWKIMVLRSQPVPSGDNSGNQSLVCGEKEESSDGIVSCSQEISPSPGSLVVVDIVAVERMDHEALTHVSLALGPAMIGIAMYSLLYRRHVNWYSWIVDSLADAVYFVGFISMTPQLYVNYRLRSVAHLPMRAMLYKIFSTVVDDIFAWLVDMPWKHRIMTFRDDVVFLFFLYQWWSYPVDKKRPNEYGFKYE